MGFTPVEGLPSVEIVPVPPRSVPVQIAKKPPTIRHRILDTTIDQISKVILYIIKHKETQIINERSLCNLINSNSTFDIDNITDHFYNHSMKIQSFISRNWYSNSFFRFIFRSSSKFKKKNVINVLS